MDTWILVLPKTYHIYMKIFNIWEAKVGVISLHLFNDITGSETYCRDAAIIQTIGKFTGSEIIITQCDNLKV